LDHAGCTLSLDEFFTLFGSYAIDIPNRDSCSEATIRSAAAELFPGQVSFGTEEISIGAVWNDVSGGSGHNARIANQPDIRTPYDLVCNSRRSKSQFPPGWNG